MEKKYLFKLNREMMEINILEMDSPLAEFINDWFNTWELEDKDKLELVNDSGKSRQVKINWTEKTISGRWLQSFFASYSGDYFFWQPLAPGQFQIAKLQLPNPTKLEKPLKKIGNQERAAEVVEKLQQLKQGEEIWFNLYHQAMDFSAGIGDQRLICLPYLRDLELYEYQLNTVKKVISRFKGRVLLGDEVGLGKTIEAGIALTEYLARGLIKKVLILVPPSLVNQWYTEMKWKFNQDFIRADDPKFKKLGAEAWVKHNKVIASLSTAKGKKHRDEITNITYDLIIVDEAHHLKNNKTVAWQFVNNLKKKYIFLLTATPVQNNLEELYNLITLLKPGQLKTYKYFKRNFVEDREGIEVKNPAKLRELLSNVMIRNRRSDVDVQLTKRNAETIITELEPRELKLYLEVSSFIKENYEAQNPGWNKLVLRRIQEQMGSTFSALIPSLENLIAKDQVPGKVNNFLQECLVEAREISRAEATSGPKVLELCKILKEFKGKMIIFTKFRSTLDFLTVALKQAGFAVACFHGGLRRKEKESQFAFFKEKADVLVSTEVGGEGRNMQFCNGIINFDLPWNPMAIEQRIGRIHRIGQTKDVWVYNLASKNTVEYYILDLLDRKVNMFELVVGEVDMILGDLEEKEDFGDQIMDAWIRSTDKQAMQAEIDRLGEMLLNNKQHLEKIKELDKNLFA